MRDRKGGSFKDMVKRPRGGPLLLLMCMGLFAGLSFVLGSPSWADEKASSGANLRLSWAKNYLTIRGSFPGETITVHYLEAYCRPGSTDRDWKDTVIGHRTELASSSGDGRKLKLQCRLSDGVTVKHTIRAGEDDITFDIEATNPTNRPSEAHWAQPCIRIDRFVDVKPRPSSEEYLPRSFVFLGDKLTRMPTPGWATRARYIPGQVWAPKHVDRNDVNPRPLNPVVPSNGLIGCFSSDDKWIFATAFEPYQELFQGVIVCLHSDFRIGGLKPGETKKIRGKIYLMPADVPRLLTRYKNDFPEHFPSTGKDTKAPRGENRP